MTRLRLAAAALLLAGTPLHPTFAQDGVGADQMVMSHHGNEQAGGHFLRGLALLHSFEYDRAAEAFVAAQAADPDWVMPYWGEAMTHNHPVWFRQDRDAALAALAKLGATPEARAAKVRGADEAAWLGAVELLFGEGEKEARDDAYLAHMQDLLAANPDDVDLRAFTGLAMLGTAHEGRDIPTYMLAASILEPAYSKHEMHPGVLHYLIHSYDDPVHAPLGLRAAERYAKVAPDAGHAQHMVSHIFTALGMWEDAEEANVNAMQVVNNQRAAADRPPAHCGHYNEWLIYARLQQGKDASTMVDACRAAAAAALADGNASAIFSYALSAAREGGTTGRWPTALDWPEDEGRAPQILVDYGEVLAARDDPAAARAALERLETLVAVMKAEPDATGMEWVDRMVAQAAAVVMLAEGRTEEGLAALDAAGDAEAALPVIFGPPMMPRPSHEILGDELAALGRTEEARVAYEKSLAFAPGRLLTLRGLAALGN